MKGNATSKEISMPRMLPLLFLILCCAIAPPAEAVNPACGQHLIGSWTLTSDMDCRTSLTHGVTMDSFASLDCANFLIWGPDMSQPNGTQTGRYGIYIDEAEHVTVSNCRVKGYEIGVRVSDSHAVTITATNAKQNPRYGYNVVRGSAVTLDNVWATSNGDEGIHLSGPFDGAITIQNAYVSLNWEEGVYFHRANLATLQNSTVENNSQNPNASHAEINLDETTDALVSNVKTSGLVRTIAQPQESLTLCVSSVPLGCL